MSDLIVSEWLRGDRLFILGVELRGSTNVSTIVVERVGELTSYSFVNDDEHWDGPNRIERMSFDLDHIKRGIEDAEEVEVISPREVSLLRTYFTADDSVRSVIEEMILIGGSDEVPMRLTRENAAYPYSLVLHHGFR